MSTDELTARARAEVRTLDAVPEAAYTAALLSELADEVDQLRAEVDSKARDGRLRLRAMTAERDAARAALERVRAIATLAEHGASGFAIADALTEALEGES